MIKEKIATIINEICEEKNYSKIDSKTKDFLSLHLRNDIGFDSFDLAQLTVMVEDEFDVDIFEDGIVDTIGEVVKKVS